MENELKFQKDDIIEYCDEHFIVLDVNYSNTGGIVAEWNGEEPGQVITNFKWDVHGVQCKLVKRPNASLNKTNTEEN